MPTLSLEDVSIYFEEAGAGTPVLLLHGLGSSGRDWELVRDRLAAEHRLVIPDVRGHGRSDKPKGTYSVPLLARDVAALCDRLGLSGLHVAGLSMGGMIAFELAVARPDLVRSLVIINSGPDMVPRTLSMRLALGLRILILRLFGPPRLARLIAKRLFPRTEQAELRQRLESTLGANDPEVYLAATRGLIGWSVLPRLSEIRCPVLVLASERDYTPLSAKQAYVARLKDARLVPVKDSGHAAPLDQPLRVSEAMSRFFCDVDARPPGGEK
jgi:3-oxoadipate enol-lactonase